MTNLEKLQHSTPADKTLADFITARGQKAIDLVNGSTFNRGDFLEMALTLAPVFRDGLHGVSKGDAIFTLEDTALLIEIKYLTKKTSASEALQGTTATHYLIACNDGKRITLRLMKKEQIKTRDIHGRVKITYQDNYNLGQEIALGGSRYVTARLDAVEQLSRLLVSLRGVLELSELSNDYLYTRGDGWKQVAKINRVQQLLNALKD